jgi:hypothetical protein
MQQRLHAYPATPRRFLVQLHFQPYNFPYAPPHLPTLPELLRQLPAISIVKHILEANPLLEPRLIIGQGRPER